MTNDDLAEHIAFREANFVLEFAPPHTKPLVPGEMVLRVTHNGYQWSGIQLSPHEGYAVARRLIAHYGIEAILSEPRTDGKDGTE